MAGLRSMTGFSRLRKLTDQGEMVVTIKSVNHRSLDVHVHMPADLDAYENAIRSVVKRQVHRGHVEVRISWNRASATTLLSLNKPLFESWLTAFRDAQKQYDLHASKPDLNTALRVPGMLSQADAEPDERLEALLIELAGEALELFNASRAKEGASLAKVIEEANSRIQDHASVLAAMRTNALPILQVRLQERLANLLAGNNIDPQRLIQEAAILADRSDITEEIHRLQIHSGELKHLLKQGGELGKKLDFLMQEMGRETNTILSKTGGAADIGLRITDVGIAVKSEIERIREQSLNLE